MTPGATNPDVTQENIASTICIKGGGYTETIRPPMYYTNAMKKAQIRQFVDNDPRHFEEDHLICNAAEVLRIVDMQTA